MLTRRHLVVSMLALSAAGCAAQSEPVLLLQKSIEIGPLGDDKSMVVQGVEQRHDAPYLGVMENKYRLLSWVFTTEPTRYHLVLVFHHYFGNEIGWNAASDAEGNRLGFMRVRSDANNCSWYGCGFYEAFGAVLDDQVLHDHAYRGYTIVFASARGPIKRIDLSPRQIQSQLESYDRVWTERWGHAMTKDSRNPKARYATKPRS